MDASPVTYMTPADLLFRLDGTVDGDGFCDYCYENYSDYNCRAPESHWQEGLLRLLEDKYDECYGEFIENICQNGIQRPICVSVTPDGKWIHGNGHHRTAVAIWEGLDTIPVIFSFTENFMLMKSTSDPRLPNFEGDADVPDYHEGNFTEPREGEPEFCAECGEDEGFCICDEDEKWDCPECYATAGSCLCR